MSEIRYVCLSDTHFGEEDSLLTCLRGEWSYDDPEALPPRADPLDLLEPSPVLKKLVERLGALVRECNGDGRKPVLILNGDILELALADTSEAAMAFERFVDLTFRPKGKALFEKKVLYVPGNHDHHLWEIARETQYVEHVAGIKRRSPQPPCTEVDASASRLPVPWHVTNMFSGSVSSYFLNSLVQKRGELPQIEFRTSYPNLGLVNGGEKRMAIFTHGHFIEPRYHLMSDLRTYIPPRRGRPEKIWDIESENFAWIDFFWSAMGRSGEFGRRTEMIYEKMLDRAAFRELFVDVIMNVAGDKLNLSGLRKRAVRFLLKGTLHGLADRLTGTEKASGGWPLSKKGKNGLGTYVSGPLLKQMLGERKGEVPPDVALVFGHTHKPYQRTEGFDGYPSEVQVYNTGGWVVETVKREPLHGGAVVLLDEDLNAVSIRAYNETDKAEGRPVEVREAGDGEGAGSQLRQRVEKAVHDDKEQWRAFAETVAKAVDLRARFLRERIARAT